MADTSCKIPNVEIDLVDLDRTIDEEFGGNPETLIMILQAIQKKYNYLPEAALRFAADKLAIPVAQFYTVATFYAMFSLTPKGKHIISVCTGTACHLKGSDRVVEGLCTKMGVKSGCTTEDGMFTLETVNCVGACALAMTAIIDEKYMPKTNLKQITAKIDELAAVAETPSAAAEAAQEQG